MEVVDSDEEYLDDPIKLIDYEQHRFGMTTQGFDAFKEVLPNITQTYLSNHERLFDTFCNAYKCKPMSVQLVDCVKYHRYYKLKPIENMGRYQLQTTFKRKTIKKVSDLKQLVGNFDKVAVSSCRSKTNFTKKYTHRRDYGKNNEVSLKDVEVEDACYCLSQLNSQAKEVVDNGTEPTKLFNQNINSTEKLPVIEHVFSLNCSIDRNTLNNQYHCEDKRRLRNVIKLINLHGGTEKIEESQISYNAASVESRSGIVTNNISEPELQAKENKLLHVIDIDTEDNNKPNKTTNVETNRNDNPEKEFDNPKEIVNFPDINKDGASQDFKGYYEISNINRIVAKYRNFTPLPSYCFSQSLNVGKPEVPYYHIPQVSRVFIQSSKPERDLSQRKECSGSATKNKVYVPCIYLKSVKNFSGVSSVDNFGNNRLMKDREITRNLEPGEVINNNLCRSNVSKGYSPPILPIPTYETLLDRFSQFRSRLLFTKSNVLPSLRTVLEESELVDV